MDRSSNGPPWICCCARTRSARQPGCRLWWRSFGEAATQRPRHTKRLVGATILARMEAKEAAHNDSSVAIEPVEDHRAGCDLKDQQHNESAYGIPELHQRGNTMDNHQSTAAELNSAHQEPWSLPMKERQQPRPGPKRPRLKQNRWRKRNNEWKLT